MGDKLVKNLRANPENPRVVSEPRLKQLSRSMGKYGDISGITFNIRSGNLATGHQRASNFDETAKVIYTKKFAAPDKYGTVAYGHILHQGSRWNYREVDWDNETEIGAMHAANNNAGEWDLKKMNAQIKQLVASKFDIKLTMHGIDKLAKFRLDTTTVREHERKSKSEIAEKPKEFRCPHCNVSLAFMHHELTPRLKTVIRKKSSMQV